MAATRFRVFLASSIAAAAVLTAPVGAADDDRTVVHVLNRLGYGPTAAAIEQVKRVSVRGYIEAQLRPERLADSAMAAKLARFTTLSKSSRELAEDYFLPAMIERRDQKRQAGQSQDAAAMPDAAAGPETRTPSPDARAAARTPEQMQLMR